VIPELFRTWPGTLRSEHPIGSFAARGPNAATLTRNHQLLDMFGDSSPLGTLYAMDGYILLLGVDHGNNTSLHLAENRANWSGKLFIHEGTAMMVKGVREWVSFKMMSLDTDDFNTIGNAYESQAGIQRGQVGEAVVRLLRQRPLVDFAVEWMEANRKSIWSGGSMPEADTISSAYLPLTVDSLIEQFGQCGLQAGQTVLVHSSLSQLGWVAGGAQAVVQG
jgi:aminoglycoside 3-N-acetyltransferase